MDRAKGSIDFSAVEPVASSALTVDEREGVQTARLPGIELEWTRGFGDVAATNGVLAFSIGDRGRASGAATRWLERYREFGERAAANADGGFAVAIVDCRQRRALLFVDRFAIETLCYGSANGKLGFATSARDVPRADKTISAQAIYDYLYFHMIPSPRTIFAEIRRVEPAHVAIVDAQSVRTTPYWTPSFVEDDDRDLEGRLSEFVTLVERSVEAEASEPATACFLSGGTDSSTVAGMLARLRGAPVAAYSIGFKASGYDEMEYARIAARHFGLDHHEYYITPDDLVESIPNVADSFDQPFGNSSVVPAYYCALRAREDGFTRMLAGDGGDELFGGNSRYATQKLFDVYHALPQGLRTAVLEPPARDWVLFRRVPGFRQLGGYVRHSMVTMPARLETFNLMHQPEMQSLLEPDFAAKVDPAAPYERQSAVWNAVDARTLTNRMLGYDWKFTLADSDLPKVRSASHLAGVRVGYPFLSRALTDFSLSLPAKWKLKGLKLRWFFKEALRDFLPGAILRKKKHGFGLPFGIWVLDHAKLRDLVHDALDGISRRGIVRPQLVATLSDRHLAESPGYYGEMAWILMMLELWLRRCDTAEPSTPNFLWRSTRT